ncbi:MAG: hypothetical protein MUC37_12150 [Hyphomicrobium sp.]|jgi:hypothetical protein|nr:hypothetical protein [Hyphomicrobium sp.]
MKWTPAIVIAFCAAVALGLSPASADEAETGVVNDYPTFNRADYIYGCMQVNGNTRIALERCACSIDVIASILPFKEYEEAETIMSLRQRGGESVAQFNRPEAQVIVHKLKQAQLEGELRCF